MSSRRTLVSAAIALAIGSLAPAVQAVELVTNGNFETGTFSGWTIPTPAPYSGVGYYQASRGGSGHGTYDAFLGPISGLYSISQTLTTVSGENYAIRFDFQNDAAVTPNNAFKVTFGDQVVTSLTNAAGFSYYTAQSFLTAASNSTTLTFTFMNGPVYWHIDNVSVTGLSSANPNVPLVPTPVPEPETYAMLLAGLGVVGWLGRRRSAAART